jgi:predicted nucleic acid-binding protein
LGHRQLTDAYLLALAVDHQGRLVTLDGAVALKTVHGATPDHLVRLLP